MLRDGGNYEQQLLGAAGTPGTGRAVWSRGAPPGFTAPKAAVTDQSTAKKAVTIPGDDATAVLQGPGSRLTQECTDGHVRGQLSLVDKRLLPPPHTHSLSLTGRPRGRPEWPWAFPGGPAQSLDPAQGPTAADNVQTPTASGCPRGNHRREAKAASPAGSCWASHGVGEPSGQEGPSPVFTHGLPSLGGGFPSYQASMLHWAPLRCPAPNLAGAFAPGCGFSPR